MIHGQRATKMNYLARQRELVTTKRSLRRRAKRERALQREAQRNEVKQAQS